MAASGSSPALAAPESAQLRFTLANALNYRHTIYTRPDRIERIPELQTQVRKKGNAATHYFRNIFTLKDGTPLINFLDFSHVEYCKINCFKPVVRACGTCYHEYKVAFFIWKALVAVGLTDAQLFEFLHHPITSVKFVPSSTSEEIYHRPGNDVSDTATWSWIFEREDGSWIALEPGLAGKEMNFQIAALADHPRHTGIVLTPRRHVGDPDNEASWERVWERRLAILYGGLEEEVWRRHMVEELSSGRFRPAVEFRPHGWSDNIPIAMAIEAWILLEFERANGNPYAQDLPPIQIPSGATAIVQPLASAQPSLTQMYLLLTDQMYRFLTDRYVAALAADIAQDSWDCGMSSDSEEQRFLNLDDESAMREAGYINDGRPIWWRPVATWP